MRIHVTFDPVKRTVSRNGYCPVCGRRTTRQTTFSQTLNPYNVNADGVPKTSAEIQAELIAQVKAWNPDFTHEGCRETLDNK